MANQRHVGARSNNNFHFSIDGAFDGTNCLKVDGGQMSRDTTTFDMGGTLARPVALGGKLKYAPINFDLSFGMGERVLQWINNCFRALPDYKTGSIIEADMMQMEQRRLDFFRMLPQKIELSACDPKASDAMKVSVTGQPEYTEAKEGTGAKLNVSEGASHSRDFIVSHFKLVIDALGEDVCQHVTKVDALTFTINTAEDSTGTDDVPGHVMTGVEQPTLKITYNPGANQAIDAWAHSQIHQGLAAESNLTTGSLTYYNLAKQPIGQLTFERIGIHKTGGGSWAGDSKNLAQQTAELYVAGMQMQLNAGAMDNV